MILKKDNIISNKQLGRIVDYDNGWTQITIDDARFYKKENLYYPSVTYILSYYPKGKQFENWLKENGHGSNVIAAESADRGTTVHKAIEKILENPEIELKWIEANGQANYSVEEWLMILRFVEFWNVYKPKLIASEVHIFSSKNIYAGTIDLIIELNGELWIIDLKTSKSLHTIYDLQLSAYQEAWNELFPEAPINKYGILWLKANTRKPGSEESGKIQGRGWQLYIPERSHTNNFDIFIKTYDIFKVENPDAKPITEKYPNTTKLIIS